MEGGDATPETEARAANSALWCTEGKSDHLLAALGTAGSLLQAKPAHLWSGSAGMRSRHQHQATFASGSMYSYIIYFGLKVLSRWVLWAVWVLGPSACGKFLFSGSPVLCAASRSTSESMLNHTRHA